MAELRVLYVNQTAQVSGAERSLLSLLRGLDGGVEPLVACPEGELAEEVRRSGMAHAPIHGTDVSFRLHALHTSRGLVDIARSAAQVRRVVSRYRPDVVHANTTRASLLALLARPRSGPPTIAHIRDSTREGRFPRFVLGLVARRADAIVANSRYVADQFDGLPVRGVIRVMHNPVDLAHFDPRRASGEKVRRELGMAEEAVVLAVVAQLTALKGQDEAIRITARLAAGDRDVALLIVGSAKFADPGTQLDNVGFERHLHELVAELRVADRVSLLGERSDVRDVLAATDILLMPSLREAFGRIAIEAMAMGVPVVAADVGGPREIVRHGVDGLLLPPGDTGAWVEALRPLLGSASLRREMGRAGIQRAHDFDVAGHVADMRALYEELAPR